MLVLGQSGAQRGVTISYDKTRGRRGTPDFSGTYDAMCGVAASLGPNVDWEIQPLDPPLYGLTIREPALNDGTPPDESGTVNWELLANAVQKDIFQHPRAQALDQDFIRDIQGYFDGDSDFPFWMEEGWSPPAPDDAVTLFNLCSRKIRHYESDNYVLRKTQIVPFGTTIEIGYLMTGLLFTNNQMTSAVWGLEIPIDLVFSIAAISPPWGWSTPAGSLWAWLKRSPQVEQMSGNKWRIVDEFWFENWSTFIYKPAPASPALLT